jgi:hypothetical protein
MGAREGRCLYLEGLVPAVGALVDLQPLQHVEALPTALRAAPERPVVPGQGGGGGGGEPQKRQ